MLSREYLERRASWECSLPRNEEKMVNLEGSGMQPPLKQQKVSELSLPVHCEVDLINGGHWEGAHVGAPTWW